TVSLFAGHLIADFNFPLDNQGPFNLKLKAFDWNYATMAAFVGGGPLLSEYETAVTGALELSAPQGGFWRASGEGTIQKLVLKRGNLELRNPKPMKITMDKGIAEFQQFRIDGGNAFVQLNAGRL